MRVSRRTLVALIAGAALLILVGVAVYGLVAGPPAPPAARPAPTVTGSPSPAPRDEGPAAGALPATADPVRFARAVADELFGWDTATSRGPVDIIDRLLTVADPTGQEIPGLYADLQAHLPTTEQWARLREYETTQRLEVTIAAVPAGWAEVAAASGDELPAGAVAVTVDGTRVREGTWHGQSVVRESPLAVTFLLSCPDASSPCSLLRVSAPGKALR